MAITLPRASPASGGEGRGRRAALPDAGSVPQVRLASDPGVRVPDFTRFAGGFGDLGAGLSIFGEGLQRAADKQQKRHDFNETSSALLAFESEAMEEFRRRQTEDDPARPAFMRDFEGDLSARLETGISGLEGVSEEATERLRIRMQTSLQGMVDAAGRLSLQAGAQKAGDNIEAIRNQAAAQAERDPDFLKPILDQANDRLGEFRGALTADQERDALEGARQDIILSAITGLVRAGRFKDAELLLASGEFDEDLNRAARGRANAVIVAGERQALVAEEKANAAAEAAIKDAQNIRAAELTDGVLEGTATDIDLDAALADREVSGSQFIALRKLLDAQQEEEATEDDPAIVLALTERLQVGNLTKDDVIDSFARKWITQSTMNRLLGEVDASPDSFRTKEQRRLLRENVGGASGLGAILGEKATRKVNDATQEFNERTRGPNAEDPLMVRKDIESRAAEPRSLGSFFRPRFLVGDSKETMDARATKKATVKAFRARKITIEQATRELRLIDEIEAAIRSGR